MREFLILQDTKEHTEGDRKYRFDLQPEGGFKAYLTLFAIA